MVSDGSFCGGPGYAAALGALMFWALASVALIGSDKVLLKPTLGCVLLCVAAAPSLLGVAASAWTVSYEAMASFTPSAVLLIIAATLSLAAHKRDQVNRRRRNRTGNYSANAQ